MEGTITAKIGYLYFSAVEKERMGALLQKSMAELTEVYPGITFASSRDEKLPPILADIKTAEDFLYGGGLTFPCHRYLWSDVDCEVKGLRLYDSHVLMTLYHDSNVCQVGVYFTVEAATPQELIYLRQIFGSSTPVTKDGTSISGLADRLFAPMGASTEEAETGYTLEITDFYGEESLEDVLRENAQVTYGMLTGDEGYEYVPLGLAKKRIASCWGSRDFFSAIAFRNNFLLFHLVNGSRAEAYRDYQTKFGTTYYGSPNPYFFMNSRTACVNHGLFFSAETGLVAKTICSHVLNHQSKLSHETHLKVRESIQTTKELRRDLIVTLNRLESIGIAELGELDRLIMSGLEIDPMVEKIKYLLELLESELDLLYQTSTNTLVNILTVVGLLLSVAQVIVEFCGIR